MKPSPKAIETAGYAILAPIAIYFAIALISDARALTARRPEIQLSRPVDAPVEPKPHRTRYDAIVGRDIFNERKVPEPPGPAPTLPPLNVRAIGTADGIDGRRIAILESLQGGAQTLVHEGERVLERIVSRIDRDEVGLSSGNGEEVLIVPLPSSEIAAMARGGKAPVRLDEGTVLRQLVVASAEPGVPKVTAADATSYVVGGKQVGMRIERIAKRSAFEAIGFATGDVVLSVNGKELSDPLSGLALLSKIDLETKNELVVLRGSEKTPLRYAPAKKGNQSTAARS